jgi:hypothetical protein
MVVPDPPLAPVMPPVIIPMVQIKLLGIEAVKLILAPAPLQIVAVLAVVTTGAGLTVTVIVYAAPAQEPAVEVGVIIYCTVPAVPLLGLFNVWLIVAPEPALAPVMLPVIVPIVQTKLLAIEAVRLIFELVPLQITKVFDVVITGLGFTVTVIVREEPAHEPVVVVGVTRYSTVPVATLLGLISVWLMAAPEPVVAPVMPPVIVPTVQAKLLGALDVKMIFGLEPLHILAVGVLVTVGVGLTVPVIV